MRSIHKTNSGWFSAAVSCASHLKTPHIGNVSCGFILQPDAHRSRFSMIVVMVRLNYESLKTLKGALFGGQLSKPVKLKIDVDNELTADVKNPAPKIGYIIDGKGPNELIMGFPRVPMPFFRPKCTGTSFGLIGTATEEAWNRLRNRQGTN